MTLIRVGLADPDDHGVEMSTIARHVAVHGNSGRRLGWKFPELFASEIKYVVDLEANGHQLVDVVASLRVSRDEGRLERLTVLICREVQSILQAEARQFHKVTFYRRSRHG